MTTSHKYSSIIGDLVTQYYTINASFRSGR